MYKVRNTERNTSYKFKTLEECINFINGEVHVVINNEYENDEIDKYVVEDILFNLDEKIRKQNGYSHPDLVNDSWIIEGNHINDNDSFETWCASLSSEDIDLVDKLDNMCNNEINEELYDLVNKNESQYYPRIEKYIKEHIMNYKDFIITETYALYNQELTDSNEDWTWGLYNCDEIYVRAIADSLGFLWLVN